MNRVLGALRDARLSETIFLGSNKGDQIANVLFFWAVTLRACTVSFRGVSGIRHSIDVEADSLYEAAVVAVARFRADIWGEAVANGTALEVEVREPSTKHSLTLLQIERWLATSGSPYEMSKKAKLKVLLVKG
jgi:hypothetical protein